MANQGLEAAATLAIGSYDTALCIIPPRSLWPRIDRLRSRYDKAYGKWPPHVNLIYPFVQVDSLPRAVEAVQSATRNHSPFWLQLNSADVFQHRHDNTIFIHGEDEVQSRQLKDLRRDILESLGQQDAGGYRMHMTIGQSEHMKKSWHHFLLEKAKSLPRVEWEASQIHVLVRERLKAGDSVSTQMKAWATISLKDGSLSPFDPPQSFCDESTPSEEDEGLPYLYGGGEVWRKPSPHTHTPANSSTETSVVGVATYNVLAEFSYPPSQTRYPLVVQNILSAKTDVLALQEVTDDFLSYLLNNQDIRDSFPFCSHGPPHQEEVEPLPNHNNIVILSKHMFEWQSVPFNREHKGAVVARFGALGQWNDADFRPLIMAAVHLSHGLKDGSITAKQSEIDRILKYLEKTYPDHPTILAGDFNISTSSYTIEQALEKKAVSSQAVALLRKMGSTFIQSGFVDTWTALRLGRGMASDDDVEQAFEGEQGATYDPTENALAAEIVGSGFNMRPQRYDRILVQGDDFFQVLHFNKFGYTTEELREDDKVTKALYASDHWGVRAILKLGSEPENQRHAVGARVVPVQLARAEGCLADPAAVLNTLKQITPSDADIEMRAAAFQLLKNVIIEASASSPVVVVPVGSYGLGVWDSSSDIDCLCIGPFSPSTFFSLATERLRKAGDKGVRIVRRVKAHMGTMLELDVQGIKVDLQYASAHVVAENWPDVLKLPASHTIWALSAQTLSKLKSIRDLDYVRRSVPDMVSFRLAHRLIRTWAKRRGIYAAKYGYLGGFQITILLARVCKLLARDVATGSVSDVLTTFFSHYAGFDWKNDLAFDPFFHEQLNYRRTDREPLAILGYFPPSLNANPAASMPSVRTMSEEFQRADSLLSKDGMTWSEFLDAEGAADFLASFKSYVKIDVQFWGGSPTKGRSFVGWLESRCVSLLVDIQRRLPDMHARLWPARYIQAADKRPEDNNPGDYQGFYLIGLDKLKDGADEKIMLGTLISILRRFEEQIRNDTKYFDERTSWMSAVITKAADLKAMEIEIDGREWGHHTIGEDESDEEDEDEGEQVQSDHMRHDKLFLSKKGKTNQPRSAMVPKPEGAGKFRTAADVMNRLRWDPALDSSDYVVGYEDRFVGAMEKGLDAWKSEQTDEEFIPQHRILYFKRQRDGVVVWERRTRKDLLFGSG